MFGGACNSSKERERDFVNDGGEGETPLAVVMEYSPEQWSEQEVGGGVCVCSG